MPEDRLLQPDAVDEMVEWFSLGEPTDRELWKALYGFDHDCHCEEDYENDNTERVSPCFLDAAGTALQELRAMRGYLFTIATSPINDVSVLKSLAAAALNMKVLEVA